MNKLKETTVALQEHLARDERGHELLDELTRIANDQRKDLAAAKDLATRLEQVAKDLRQQLEAQRKATADAVRRAELTDANRKQAERERGELADSLRAAQEEIAKLQPDLEPFELAEEQSRLRKCLRVDYADGDVIDPKQLTAEFNRLRKQMRACPCTLNDIKPPSRAPAYYSLDSIVDNLSYEELLKLGRFVAIRALFNFPCTIVSGYTVMEDDNNLESLRPFIEWLAQGTREEYLTNKYNPPPANGRRASRRGPVLDQRVRS